MTAATSRGLVAGVSMVLATADPAEGAAIVRALVADWGAGLGRLDVAPYSKLGNHVRAAALVRLPAGTDPVEALDAVAARLGGPDFAATAHTAGDDDGAPAREIVMDGRTTALTPAVLLWIDLELWTVPEAQADLEAAIIRANTAG
ncbi:hypothetical protein [Oharaeibacter diazotrophicus]|uniref:Uncharacterized protein n=1 Tax=Oharaeibacter diazotrophicus TaxID=1920512 RepID=A0A4R6RBW0_9HYPH|nr:hypothetical protein [Oharaeibacter diazotrophicus]TDP83559.1 hypothetical protein EDD54_3521 [Oharaeibacter diazotrophicus]BBE72392.1 hypothetical protein OHA_1_01982 [Pleomorphomonas sp. SM30]GLS79163.1 hypothetical protein GCM10007904_45000 [Oharaeibacter diazotrophicus]